MHTTRRLLQQINDHLPSAPPPEPLTVDSDIVVILAALLCALICVVGLALVARCAWLRRSSSSAASPPAPPNKGLKKKVLRSLPRLAFLPGSADHARFADCPICLAEFAEGDEIRVLPQCGHGFHVACVDMWLASHSSCPSCRQILVSGAASSAAAVAAPARCEKCGATSAAPAPAAAPAEASLGTSAPSPPQDLDARTVTVTVTKARDNGDAHSFLP